MATRKRRRRMGQAPTYKALVRPSKPCTGCGRSITASGDDACIDCQLHHR